MKRFQFSVALLKLLGLMRRTNADDATVQSISFDSNGVKIAYVIAGKGKPVVLVHGLYSSAEMNWQLPGTVKLLAQHYRVVTLDLRGHGKSDKPTDESDYGNGEPRLSNKHRPGAVTAKSRLLYQLHRCFQMATLPPQWGPKEKDR